MRRQQVSMFFFQLIIAVICIQPTYSQIQPPMALRIDWMLGGNASTVSAFLVRLKAEPFWGGPAIKFIDKQDLGKYRILVTDTSNLDTLYCQGFCTLFEEWQTTMEARTSFQAFQASNQIPFPSFPVNVQIQERQQEMSFKTLLTSRIHPGSVTNDKSPANSFDYQSILESGPSDECVDIAFIAEGYQLSEKEKFYRDAKRITDYLISQEPFKSYRHKLNIRAVASVSIDSGTDDPNQGIWKNTICNSGFNTFQTDRYLESLDLFSIKDIASNVPYDQIVVLVNTSKYGGGGVFNHFSVAAADHPTAPIVFIHEFGHAFGGLGDEYFTSEVAYQNYIDLRYEPWEPNLTTLVDFEKKWKNMLTPGTPVPTPDSLKHCFPVGVYEGGGYVASKVYRPAFDCRMKSNQSSGFCKVCLHAIEERIKTLTKNK